LTIEGAGGRVKVTQGEILRDICELDGEREDGVVLSATCGCLLGYSLMAGKGQSDLIPGLKFVTVLVELVIVPATNFAV
jgi:hypothetical protein